MAFTITIDKKLDVISIIKSLEPMCSVLTLEFSEHGLGLSMSDDNDAMAFSFEFRPSMFEPYEFNGSGVDKIALSTEKFVKILNKMSFPFQIESTMDGGIRLASVVGRQSYKLNTVEAPEKYFAKSERVKTAVTGLVTNADAIVIDILHQDLKEALRKVSIDSKNVTITLDGDKLSLVADSIEVDAETEAPLIHPVTGEWKMTYNVKFFIDMLKVINTNRPMQLSLFPDRRSFVAVIYLEDGNEQTGASSCILSLAPVLQRREASEEAIVEEEEFVEDEPDSEME